MAGFDGLRPRTAPAAMRWKSPGSPDFSQRPKTRGSIGVVKRTTREKRHGNKQKMADVFVIDDCDFDLSVMPAKADAWRYVVHLPCVP